MSLLPSPSEPSGDSNASKSAVAVAKDDNSVAVSESPGRGSTNVHIGTDGLSIKSKEGKKTDVNFSASDKGLDMHIKAEGAQVDNNVDITEKDLGLKFYPNSKPVPMASMHIKTDDEEVWAATRTTHDSHDQVIDFYKSDMHWTGISNSKDGEKQKTELDGTFPDGTLRHVTVETGNGKPVTTVAVTHTRKFGSKKS